MIIEFVLNSQLVWSKYQPFLLFVIMDAIISAFQLYCMGQIEVNPDSLMPDAEYYPPK